MASKNLVFWSVAIVVFLLDRISKFLVQTYIPLGSSLNSKFVSLTHITNTGTAFGLFKSASILLLIFAILVSLYIIIKHSSFSSTLQPALGLIVGGALGNVFDRIFYGAVIDFIDVHFWPVFNIADSAVCIAVALLLFYEFKKK